MTLLNINGECTMVKVKEWRVKIKALLNVRLLLRRPFSLFAICLAVVGDSAHHAIRRCDIISSCSCRLVCYIRLSYFHKSVDPVRQKPHYTLDSCKHAYIYITIIACIPCIILAMYVHRQSWLKL